MYTVTPAPSDDAKSAERKIGRKLVVGTPKSPTPHREEPHMETFFVSLTGDLLHVYIKYQAESRLAVEQYLERQYKRKGVWTLPWCFIYTDIPINDNSPTVMDSRCGTLFEESKKPTNEVLDNDPTLPCWTFRFAVTVHAATEDEVIRLGKIDCANDNGIIEAIRQ
jgi:hypothetical protein